MDKVIVTVLLIIGGIVAVFAILNGVYPALDRSSSAINNAADQVNDQIQSQIEIINVNIENTSAEGSTIQVWVKNVGMSQIDSIENSDIFISNGTSFSNIPYDNSGTSLPYWNYQLMGNNTTWGPTVTNEISVYMASALSSGSYEVKVVIPNGISDEVDFGE